MMRNYIGLLGISVLIVLSGCRGARSEKTPFHLNPNFDWQPKFRAQMLTTLPPEGTVIWGNEHSFSSAKSREHYLKEDTVFYSGKLENGAFVSTIPVRVDAALMTRGQERFNIYCAACHDQSGTGRGMVVQRGFAPPPNLGDERLLTVQDGYLYDVISNGIRNMPGYAKQIPEADRWAIVAYVRALQKVQHATIEDVPESSRKEIK